MSDRRGEFRDYNRDMVDLRLRLPRKVVAALWGMAALADTTESAQSAARHLIGEGLKGMAETLGKSVEALERIGAEKV